MVDMQAAGGTGNLGNEAAAGCGFHQDRKGTQFLAPEEEEDGNKFRSHARLICPSLRLFCCSQHTHMRRQKERKGAIPVPVATHMTGAFVLVGRRRTFPVGPVIMISCPTLASHKKLEQTPILAGSSLPVSGSL